ncbi:DUF6527 family protein [Sphingomonas sp. KC8]|uniref:DUF6527 family protein n=1 Tax=Sphingomonas sp. KC8 TaxID=1030157 RepID=UPI00024897D1|nr:DUF6527 family protein [Sphingomonas sp. KC8]ARS29093.1 ammonia monooxygenase [Sphingomonas sp. KC8]
MSALSPILRQQASGRVAFWCPGCHEQHSIPVADTHNPGINWGYNSNPDSPTFTPSVLVRSGHYVPGHDGGTCWCNWDDKDEFPDLQCRVCHSFVTDGRIQFLSDCTHALSGQTVDLPAWPERGS